MVQISDFSAVNVAATAVSEFLHESLHVWQYAQWGFGGYAAEDARASGPHAYETTITARSSFSALNMEQQAMIVQNYYLMTHGYSPMQAMNTPTSGDFGSVLSQVRY